MPDDNCTMTQCHDCGSQEDLVSVDLGDTGAHHYTWMCMDCIASWDETGKPRWCAGEMANRLPC